MIAFWLLPAAEERAPLRSLIRNLAMDHDAPIFEPHLTLYAGPLDVVLATDVLRGLPLPHGFKLEVDRLGYSDEFTKTLFVQLHPCSALEQFASALRLQIDAGNGYELNPHISLIYREMPQDTKAALARKLTIPFASIRFDAVRLITGPDQTKTREDVEAWRTLAERRLP